jgi:hypothetical protein
MMEYAALRPQFSFLGVPKMPKNHWSDGAGWKLANCFYHQIQAKTKLVMHTAHFFSITCDEITSLDNQAWISIHGYVCENWTRIMLLLSLKQVVDGTGANSLINVIVEAIKGSGDLNDYDFATKVASFGAGKHLPLQNFVSILIFIFSFLFNFGVFCLIDALKC